MGHILNYYLLIVTLLPFVPNCQILTTNRLTFDNLLKECIHPIMVFNDAEHSEHAAKLSAKLSSHHAPSMLLLILLIS